MGKDNPIIDLAKPYEDDRGIIQLLLNKEMQSAVMITSKTGAVRANHYHTSDWHYCYVVSGSIEYYWRDHGSDDEPKKVTVKTGELFYTPPMVDHAMYFPEDGMFLTLSGSNRDADSYDDEIKKVKLI